MSTVVETPPLTLASRAEQIFPTLTAAQLARLAAAGHVRRIERGEGLMRPGEPGRFLAVRSGELQLIRPSGAGEVIVGTLGPGMFTGEINLLSGRRAFAESRASGSGADVGGVGGRVVAARGARLRIVHATFSGAAAVARVAAGAISCAAGGGARRGDGVAYRPGRDAAHHRVSRIVGRAIEGAAH